MRILLLGATGALGSRCVPALLSHSHTITAFVRDENKLRSLLPASVWSQLKVENGSATDVRSLARVIRTHEIEAVVSAAGSAPLFGSGGELPAIDHAIIAAVRESGIKMKRLWMVGGWLLLDLPGSAGTWTIYD
jgi:putative NADH-flavin reductase